MVEEIKIGNRYKARGANNWWDRHGDTVLFRLLRNKHKEFIVSNIRLNVNKEYADITFSFDECDNRLAIVDHQGSAYYDERIYRYKYIYTVSIKEFLMDIVPVNKKSLRKKMELN